MKPLTTFVLGGSGEVIAMIKPAGVEYPSEPVTRKLKLAFVATTGVPLITPSLLRLKPDGRLPPMSDHV
jgi:hypothetical protein